MRKKLVIALDILIVAIVTIIMLAGKSVENIITGVFNTPAMATNEELSFNLKASPEKSRVKAGATVVVTLSVKDIKVGEDGLNNIVGKLGYDEALFKSVEIYAGSPEELAKGEGTTKWELEINKIKEHSMYGQFCIFTMQEGVTENQEVATLIFKLKDDLKPQTTKVTFTKLASSDGEVSIPEEDREVEITIYEDTVVPDEPKTEEPKIDESEQPVVPVQTADSQTVWIIITLISTIIINILVFTKTKKNKILGSILVVLVGFLSMQYAAYANSQELLAQMAYKESWLNSENYLVTEENISRIAPNTDVENLFRKFNKLVEVQNGNENVTTGKISTGMTISVKNPGKQDAEGDFKYLVSVFGDINGDSQADHVDLTTTIRNIVNKDKWKLDGVKEISADIKLDNKIDREDVLASVKHIVYGELEIPTFEQVQAPEIKITQSTKDEERNCYTGEVKIAITQKQADAIKTQYKISKDGEETVAYTQINGEITLSGEGIYKVSAYTTGKLGNRSEIPYILVNIEKEKAQYKVEYYYDGVKDDNQTEIGYAIVGTEITEVADKLIVNSIEYKLDLNKGNGTGKENLPLIIGENTADNVIKVYYNSKYGILTIHHYNYKTRTLEEKVKVAEDEIFSIEYDKEYIVTNLMTNTNKITIDGNESTITRNYLEPAHYTYKDVEYDTENATSEEDGTVTGTSVEGIEEISYYYEVQEFTITGETDEYSRIKDIDATGLIEEVEYNQDSNRVYIKSRPGYKISKVYKYTGSRINGDYTANDGEVLTVLRDKARSIIRGPSTDTYTSYVGPFGNVRENIHLVVTSEISNSVVKIIGVPTGLEDEVSMLDGNIILGHEYESLQDAILEAEELNKKRTEANVKQPVTIQILPTASGNQRVIEEYNTIQYNNDVVIDLNGQKIEISDAEQATLLVKEFSSLTLIDTNDLQTGCVSNTSGTAVFLDENSAFTLGQNDPILNPDAPTIHGALFGLYKDPDSTFNFYDGKIIGDNLVAVGGNQKVDDTPELFKAVTITDPNNSNTQIEYLAVPSGVVAMIGKESTYTSLESAFLDAQRLSENGKKIEIDLVVDLALINENNETNGTSIIEISEDKNIVLDLNGHYINAIKENDLFINKGTFEIKDTTSEYADYYDDEYYRIESNGEYHFDFNEYGELQSNNNGKFDEAADSYIELDLTDKDNTEEFTIEASGYMYGESPRYGYLCITESSEFPEDFDSIGERMFYSTYSDKGLYYGSATKTINGGKEYYVHLIYASYRTDRSNNYEDELHINNITINGKPMLKEFYKGTGALGSIKKGITNESSTAKLIINNVNCNNLAMITNNGELESNNSALYGLTNNSDATINKGKIRRIENNTDASLELNEVFTADFLGIKNQSGNILIDNCTITNSTTETSYSNGGIVNGENSVAGNVVINNSTLRNVGRIFDDDVTITNSVLKGADICADSSIVIKDSQVDTSNIDIKKDSSVEIENITGDSTKILNANSNSIIKNANLTNASIINVSIYSSEPDYRIRMLLDNCNITFADYAYHGGGFDRSGFYNSADLQIIGGTLETDKFVNGGTLTIGEQGSPVSSTSPKLVGTISNHSNAIINFYDGSITAPENCLFESATEINIEENYSISVTRETVDGQVYETATLGQLTPVAKILKSSITNTTGIKTVNPNSNDNDNNYYYFGTLEDAIAACPDNSTNKVEIQIIDKIYLFKQLVVDVNKNIEIKLNGNEMYFAVIINEALLNKGNLSIIDEQVGKGIVNPEEFNNGYYYVNNIKNEATGILELNCAVSAESIINEGTTIIDGQIIDNQQKTIYNTLFKNSGDLIFNGGYTIKNIENTANSTFIINGGSIGTNVSTYPADGTIYVKDNSKLIINGGYVGASIIINEHENPTEPALRITGGCIGATNYYHSVGNPITNNTSAEIVIKSADLENKIDIATSINTSGKITIEDVVGHQINNGIRLETSNVAIIKNSEISGATISATEEKTSTIDNCNGAIEATGEANINITNTVMYVSSSSLNALINSGNGNIVVTNSGVISNYPITSVANTGAGSITLNNVVVGRITNSGSGTINIPYSNNTVANGGIDNNGSGNVIIGTEDSTVDTEYPKISGTSWGIRNNGTGHIYVYDGSITGNTNQAKSGNIDCLAGYELIDKETGNVNRQTLILGREFCARVAVDNVQNANNGELTEDELCYQFFTIQDAINAAMDNTETVVEITRNLNGSSAITVGSSKNIVLDINGYGLNIATDNLITNNGNLTITNTKSTGDITVTSENIITNNNNLLLKDVLIKVNKSGTEGNILNVINNNEGATFNMVNAQISITGSNINGVLNNGTFNMSKLSRLALASPAPSQCVLINYGQATITNSNIENGNVYNYNNGELNIVKDITDSSLTEAQKNNNYGIITGGLINDGTGRTEGTARPKVVFDSGYASMSYYTSTYRYFPLENNDGEITFKNEAKISGASQLANNNGIIKIEDAELSIGTINNDETSQIIIDNVLLKLNSIENDGTVNINGGEIRGSSNNTRYQAQINNNNILTIGNKQDNINIESSLFVGRIINSEDATFNLYDGTIFSNSFPFDGNIDDIPANATIRFENTTKTIEGNTQQGIAYYVSTDTVAKIGNTEYTTLKDAFDACTDSTQKTIVLQANIVQLESISIDSNKNIILDLNGNTIAHIKDGYLFTNSGEFELTDSSTDGEGKIISYNESIVDNTNILTISGGNYSFGYSNLSLQMIVKNSGNGTINMIGGTINVNYTGSNDNYAYGIRSEDAQDINISGGTIKSENRAVGVFVKSSDENNKTKVNLSGTCKFEGRFINSYSAEKIIAPIILSNCEVVLQDNIEIEAVSTLNSNINILGGTIVVTQNTNSNVTIPAESIAKITDFSNSREFNSSIEGGTIENAVFDTSYDSSQVTIQNSNIKNLEIGGNINVTANISNIELDRLTIIRANVIFGENVKILSTNDYFNALTIQNANVIIPEDMIIRSEFNRAIICDYNCTVTLGTDDRRVNSSGPNIYGKIYGFVGSSNTTLQFYDGTIHGDTAWGLPANIITPEHYEIAYSDLHPQTSEPRTATLRFKAEFSEAAKVDDTNYSLAGAINAIDSRANHTGTIEIIDNIGIESGVTIKSGMNVTIDLKGKSIYSDLDDEPLITVEQGATLTIINTNTNQIKGSIENVLGLAIDNKGTLNIGDNQAPIETDMIEIIGGQYAIDNSGTFNFYDGKIKAEDEDVISGTGTINHAANSIIRTTTENVYGMEYNVKYLEEN